MSLPPYPKYKNSGVAWLGEVPEGWGIVPLKKYIFLIDSGVSVNSIDIPANDLEFGVLKTSCVSSGIFNPIENKTVVQEEVARVSCSVKKDSLIVSRMNTPALVGAAGFVKQDYPCLYLPDRLWQVKFKKIPTGFVYYWTQSKAYRAQVEMACSGTSSSMQNLGQDQFSNFVFSCPPVDEALKIFNFLDRETAKIDALIAEQEKLISLLAEKRQATISHAVTKGLDPSAPMKDSGVAWLGEVPEGWEVGAVKRFFKGFDDRRIPLSASDRGERQGEYPYYGASGVIDFVDDYIFSEELVLVSEDGANLLNRSSPIAFIARGKYWVNNHAHILKPIDENLVFWSERIEALDLKPVVTGSAQPKLTADALMNLMISVPPTYKERFDISLFINTETARLDALSSEASRAIALLKERRSALISAAVTGKIDVRSTLQTEAL